MVKGFAHVALYTDCFEETVKFYETVFDAKSLGAFETFHKGTWLDLNGDILEIFSEVKLGDGLFKHIAISCTDLDALYEKALANGASAVTAPKDVSLPLNERVNARIAFVAGPAGEQIELFEIKE